MRHMTQKSQQVESLLPIHIPTICILCSLCLLFFNAAMAGDSLSVSLKGAPGKTYSVSQMDSIKFPGDSVELASRGTAAKISAVDLDSIYFGPLTQMEAYPSKATNISLTLKRLGFLDISPKAWGANWAYQSVGGGDESVQSGTRSYTLNKQLGSTGIFFDYTQEISQMAENQITFTYTLKFDAAASDVKFATALKASNLYYGNQTSWYHDTETNTWNEVSPSFPRGSLSGLTDSMKIVDNNADTTLILFQTPTGISADSEARLNLFSGDAAANTTYTLSFVIQTPEPIKFYPDRSLATALPPQQDWFELSVGDSGLPIDLSFLNKDENGDWIPAGTHGFLTVDGDRFVFEDGTPARFWGINVTAGAAKGDSARAIQVAERLARNGFNIVRLHHLDSWGTTLYSQDHPDGTTQHLNQEVLAKLDFFVAELKKRGIYIVLDPWVGRKFREADNVPLWEDMSGNFGLHPYVFFNERIQDLTKLYLTQVWTHVNPITGLAYKDDPAFVWTEVINEGLFKGPKEEPYKSEFIDLYKQWARDNDRDSTKDVINKNYGTTNLDFYMHVQKTFFDDFYQNFRDIGVQIPINATNWSFWTWDIVTQLDLDFMDVHHYYGGDFLGAGSKLGGAWTEHSIYQGSTPWGAIAKHAAWNKALTMSEGGQTPPKHHRGAYFPSLAAMAAFQEWDGITTYAFSQSGSPRNELSNWEWENDPINLGGLAVGALIYRRGDVQPAKETVAMRMPQDEWYQLRWQNNGEMHLKNLPWFNAMLETHKTVVVFDSILPAAASFAQVRDVQEAFEYQHSGTELESDTKELWRDWSKGFGTINTARTQSAFGKVGGETITTKDAIFTIRTEYASVNLSSLTNDSLSTSSKMLLVASARAINSGMSFLLDNSETASNGDAPVMAEPVVGKIRLKSSAESLKLYPLLLSGERGPGTSLEKNGDWFDIELTADQQTLYYEIAP